MYPPTGSKRSRGSDDTGESNLPRTSRTVPIWTGQTPDRKCRVPQHIIEQLQDDNKETAEKMAWDSLYLPNGEADVEWEYSRVADTKTDKVTATWKSDTLVSTTDITIGPSSQIPTDNEQSTADTKRFTEVRQTVSSEVHLTGRGRKKFGAQYRQMPEIPYDSLALGDDLVSQIQSKRISHSSYGTPIQWRAHDYGSGRTFTVYYQDARGRISQKFARSELVSDKEVATS